MAESLSLILATWPWPERTATEMKRRRLRRPQPTDAAALRVERKSAAVPSQWHEAVATMSTARESRARAGDRPSAVPLTAAAVVTAAAGSGTSRPPRFASPSTRPAARWRRMRDATAESVPMRRCLCRCLCLCHCHWRRSCGRPRPQRISEWRCSRGSASVAATATAAAPLWPRECLCIVVCPSAVCRSSSAVATRPLLLVV